MASSAGDELGVRLENLEREGVTCDGGLARHIDPRPPVDTELTRVGDVDPHLGIGRGPVRVRDVARGVRTAQARRGTERLAVAEDIDRLLQRR